MFFIKNFQGKRVCFVVVVVVVVGFECSRKRISVRICCGTNGHDFKHFSNFHFAITRDNCGHILRCVEAADIQNTTGAKRTNLSSCVLKVKQATGTTILLVYVGSMW